MPPKQAPQTAKQNEYHVPALEKGLAILEYLIASGGNSLNEICKALPISRTTAFSLLKNLVQLGYLECDKSGFYRPTLRVFSLGMQVQRNMPYHTQILPLLTDLRDTLKMTVHLSSYVGNRSILLFKLDGPGGVQFLSFVGEMKPLHLSGAGKAILAYWFESQFQAYLSSPLEVRTENTIATPDALEACRKEIRQRGYAIDNEEGERGVYCIGVPIFVTGGVIWGGLSVSMIKGLLDEDAFSRHLEVLLDAGKRLSRLLGYTETYPVITA